MDKRLLVVLIFAVLGLAVLTYGYTQQGQYTKQNNTIQNSTVQNTTQNNTVQNNNRQTNLNGTAKDNDVVITQKGPTVPQKRGVNVLIHYTVANEGKNTVYNAKVGGQVFEEDKNIGTLKPGQTEKYTYVVYIPTNKDLAEWYDSNVKLTNSLMIGGIELSFTDDKGILHGVQSNSIEIKLLK